MRSVTYFTATVFLFLCPALVQGQIVINEIHYDDSSGSPDDSEFIELYNAGASPVDISGWNVLSQDEVGANPGYTIPASTTLNAGAYYVIGNTAVPNVNLTFANNTLENDSEYTELRNSANELIDAFVSESNKGPGDGVNPPGTTTAGYGVLTAAQLAQVGTGASPGYFSNATAADRASSPFIAGSISRFVDGVDTNNNGYDFGFRPATPGATNNPTMVTAYTAPDVSALAVNDEVPGWAFGFQNAPARVMDPSTARDPINDPLNVNPNVIPAPPTGDNRVIITYDTAGGGNGYSAPETFSDGKGSFDLWVYLDTADFPQQTGAPPTNTPFRGSEISIFNIGGSDSAGNFSNLNGSGFPGTVNGTMGVAWVYEKTQPLNPGDPDPNTNGVIEKLYLVDAGDGGPNDINNLATFDWDILATVDLKTTPSGWYRLSLSIGEGEALAGDENGDGNVDAADYVAARKAGLPTDDFEENFGESGGGDNGFARFDDQEFTFNTDSPAGAFGTVYRENLQQGAVTVPFALMRPPTFVQYEEILEVGGSSVPEPSAFALAVIAGMMLAGGRKRLI